MSDPDQYQIPDEQLKLTDLVSKIEAYQRSIRDSHAVELDELQREGILTTADMEFLNSHSVTYKPHRLSDYHRTDMFHMPTEDGGCVFIGPTHPPLTKRRARLRDFRQIVENFLQLPRPQEELLLHVEFTGEDCMSVAPEMICFAFRSEHWRERLPVIRTVAAEFGLPPFQDEVIQGRHMLTFTIDMDTARIATATVDLLNRGCGLAPQAKVTYSAGALDAGQVKRVTRKKWFLWAGAVFAAQILLFAVIHFFMTGAPYWAELPYLPFQNLFTQMLGQYWQLGLVLGAIVGALVYSSVTGLMLAWIFRKKAL
jgi:hypothetical protein